jgi:hypothetical protein
LPPPILLEQPDRNRNKRLPPKPEPGAARLELLEQVANQRLVVRNETM